MRSTLVALLLLAITGGCRTVRWNRPGASEQDFYRQLRHCEQEAQPKFNFCWGAYCDAQAAELRHRIDLCLRSNGWSGRTTRGFSTTAFSFEGSEG